MSEQPNQAATKAPAPRPTSKRYLRALWSTLRTLIFIALLALVAAQYFFPVMRIHNDAMSPTFSSGDVVVSLKGESWSRGDVIAFYFNDKLLVKRIIAVAGDVISIAEDGSVTLNGEALSEPYVSVQALGECDLEMPYTVPEDRVFVMGDQRELSLDSRSSAIGCVAPEQIVGRIWMRVWPLDKFEID